MLINESVAENIALDFLKGLGYKIIYGPDIAPGESAAERIHYSDTILEQRLKRTIEKLNPEIPIDARDDAYRQVLRTSAQGLISANHVAHRVLVNGVDVEYMRNDGTIAGDKVKLIDFEIPENNEFLAVNQFTVINGDHERRPDIVLFINGLPVCVIELKNPTNENATIWSAFNQLQTYKKEIPSLFTFNEGLIITDGLEARIGTLTSNDERFMPWRTIEGEEVVDTLVPQMEVLIKGMCEKGRYLDLIRHFTAFEEDDDGSLIKKVAAYHQFHAVQNAVEKTIEASSPEGDRRCGVVWHTQGSGKSLTMVFFTGKIILEREMRNPTIVVITDRNDLDNQLSTTFAKNHELLHQKPVQADNREHLRELLQVASGGVVFTTVHKFFPEKGNTDFPLLSDRRNVVVIADEAHRSQYDFIDGFARYMRDALPNASFIGFTGTPIEATDRNTPAVFGDYISIYDIQRAVEDGSTVPIFYESRLAKIELSSDAKATIDKEFEEASEGFDDTQKERYKHKWAALEAIVGTDKRIKTVARDMVEHFESRLETMDGKAMVVCMSRRICVDLYDEIIKIRPEWKNEDVSKNAVNIVMTGSASDPLEWSDHVRNKKAREHLAKRFKDPDDPFKIAIVRDMWLTGFDAPCLHTMYVDKPMQSHGLMQAIARVNRVYNDKPGGLIVDYIGLAEALKRALRNYTRSGGKGSTAIDKQTAVNVMMEKHQICSDMLHGFDWSVWKTGTPQDCLNLIPRAVDFILQQEDGKERFIKAESELTKAFALSVPHEETIRIRDDVGFFQAMKSGLAKLGGVGSRGMVEINTVMKQIVSEAIASDQVLDIFSAVGLERPEISILSDEFLAQVKNLPQKNLAAELLQKLLKDQIRTISRRNAVQSRKFSEMLESTITNYHKRMIETIDVIEMLIQMAKEIRDDYEQGEKLGLSYEEKAFYDALGTNDSAVAVLGDEVLKQIAVEIAEKVKKTATIDWDRKESARARMRVMVKRILRKYDYPPDKEAEATKLVLEQAEVTCGNLVFA